MIRKIFNNNLLTILFSIFVCLILGFLYLGDKSFLFDEIMSVRITKEWNQMWSLLYTQEGNMWLYYLILHFWQKINQTEFFIRTLSVIFSLFTIPFIFSLGEFFFDEKTGRLAAALLPFNIFFILFAQQARSYSLLLLLTTVSTYLFIKILRTGLRKYWFSYIVVSIAAIYTHWYAGFVILVHFLSTLFYWKKNIRIFSSFLVIGIFCIPLFLSPAMSGGQIDWIEKPSLKSLIGVFVLLSGDHLFLFFLASGLILFLFLGNYKHVFFFRKNLASWKFLFIFSLLVIPIIFSYLFSLTIKPIYRSAYFISLITPFVLLLSNSIESVLSKNKTIGILLLAIIILFSSLRLYAWYSKDSSFRVIINNDNEDWRGTTIYLALNSYQNDAVIFYPYFSRQAIQYYYDKLPKYERSPKLLEISSSSYHLGGGGEIPLPSIEILRNLPNRYKRVWLVLYDDSGLKKSSRKQQVKMILNELSRNYNQTDKKISSNINLLLFQK